MATTAESCAVRIAVRERPLRDVLVSKSDGCGSVISYHSANPNILILDDRPFAFDNVLNPDVSQEQVFDVLIKPLVGKVLQGFNCTALAYGQTGTGKSYSMGLNSNSFEGENVGIIPRCLRELFPEPSSNNENNNPPIEQRKMFASFIEIYNEKVYDLFAENSSEPIVSRGYKYTGGTRKEICDIKNCCDILRQGNKNRHVRPTKMNSQSSRSHAVFSIHISFVQANKSIAASLNLVDLAGSEGVRRTGHQGVAMSEGVHINQGLLTIGKVLHAMTMGYKVIPYRDSVLTSVLQDSLSPNSYLTLLACISPHRVDLSESLSTLRFAQNAKQLKYSPQINTILAEIKKNKTPLKSNTMRGNGPFVVASIKRLGTIAVSAQKSISRNTIHHRNTYATPNKIRRIDNSKFNKTDIGVMSKVKPNHHPVSDVRSRQDTTKSSNLLDAKRVSLFQQHNDTIDSHTSLFSLNISSSTSVDVSSAKPVIGSYSPVVRKCMNEFEKIIDNKMAKMIDDLRNVQTGNSKALSSPNSELQPCPISVLETPVQMLPNTLREELKSIVKDLLVEQNAAVEKQSREATMFTSDDERESTDRGIPDAKCQLFAASSPIFKVPDISLVRKKQAKSLKMEEYSQSAYEESEEPVPFEFHTELLQQTVLNNSETRRSLRRSQRKLNESDLSTNSTTSHPLRRSIRLSSIKEMNDNKRRSIRIASHVETTAQKDKSAPQKEKFPLVKNSVIASYFGIKNNNTVKSNGKPNISKHKKAVLDLINTGTMKELQLLPQVGQKTAYQIVTQRTLNGKFKSLAEVGKLPIWRGKAWERFSQTNMLL